MVFPYLTFKATISKITRPKDVKIQKLVYLYVF